MGLKYNNQMPKCQMSSEAQLPRRDLETNGAPPELKRRIVLKAGPFKNPSRNCTSRCTAGGGGGNYISYAPIPYFVIYGQPLIKLQSCLYFWFKIRSLDLKYPTMLTFSALPLSDFATSQRKAIKILC